jgi:hypothetical protein
MKMLRAFGNIRAVQAILALGSRWMWLDRILRSLRFGARSLRQTPRFTLVAVITVALGVGANTAVFSVMNAVLLRSLPVHNPQRLVFIRASAIPNLPIGSIRT